MKMMTPEQQDKHLAKVAKKLKPLGFYQSEFQPHFFGHDDLPYHFDLSAVDPNKVMLYIWNEGNRTGRNQKVAEMNAVLFEERQQ